MTNPLPEKKLSLAMIGAGRHSSSNIYPYFHFLKDTAQVVANSDLDLERAQSVGRRFGIERHYADYAEMIRKEKPDGVLICIGGKQHAELAVRVMEMGHHVYVEKPHAPGLSESREMLKVSGRTRRICMGAYKKRFTPVYQRARALILSPEFGPPRSLSMVRTMGGGNAMGPGYLWDWGCHGTDLLTYLFGNVAEVFAWRTDDWRAVNASLRFVNGATGSLLLGTPGGSWEEVTAVGSNALGLKTRNSMFMTVYDGDHPAGGYEPSFIHGGNHSSIETGFVGELKEFVAAIRENREPEANIRQLTHTAALHEALMRSLETKRSETVEAE